MKVLSVSDCKKKATLLATSAAKVDGMIHELACSAVFHSVKDGQITPALDLVAAIGKSGRRNDLITWLIKVGNLAYDKKASTVIYKSNMPQSEELAQEVFDTLVDNPFWTVTKEQAVKTEMDILKDVKAFIASRRRIIKSAIDEGRALNVTHQDLLDKLDAIAV